MLKLTRKILEDGNSIWTLIDQDTKEDLIKKYFIQGINLEASVGELPILTLTMAQLDMEVDVDITGDTVIPQ